MDRPIQHEIDDQAKRLFNYKLPKEWVSREQSSGDYGIDYEIEIFRNNKSTGIIFKVQLKGTEHLKLIDDAKLISFSLPLDNARYLLEEVSIPALLIIADIKQEKVYWIDLQSNMEFSKTYKIAKENEQNSLTIHIPINNEFEQKNFDLILGKIEETSNVIYIKAIDKLDSLSFAKISSEIFEVDDAIAKIKSKEEALYAEKLTQLYSRKEIEKLFEEAEKLYSNLDKSIDLRYLTLQIRQKSIYWLLSNRHITQDDGQNYILFLAQEMKKLTKKGPFPLKLYALINFYSAIMRKLADHEFALFMNNELHKEEDDYFWKATLNISRNRLLSKIIHIYNFLFKLLNIAIIKNEFIVFIEGAALIEMSITPILVRLDHERDIATSEKIKKNLINIFDIAIEISRKFKMFDQLSLSAMSKAMLVNSFGENEKIKAIDELKKLRDEFPDGKDKDLFMQSIEQMEKMQTEEQLTEDIRTEDEELIYRKMAAALGIDLNNKDDRIAEIINIGLKDLNPERVLKNCQFIFLTLSGGGLPAQWLKLPTAGRKNINCTKHRYMIGGLILDRVYEYFDSEYCSKCPDKLPHTTEWKWTRKWQQVQEEIFFKKFEPKF